MCMDIQISQGKYLRVVYKNTCIKILWNYTAEYILIFFYKIIK